MYEMTVFRLLERGVSREGHQLTAGHPIHWDDSVLLFPFLEHFLKTTGNRNTCRECPGQSTGQGAGEPSMSLG